MIRETLGRSGIDIIGDLEWGTDFCLFYQTKEDLVDVLIPYFKAGLENSEFCIWILSPFLKIEEAKKALRNAVSKLDTYLEKGQIEIVSCTDWYLKEGVFDPENLFPGWIKKLNLDNNYTGVRISWDVSWLEEESLNRFIECKKQIDDVINNCRIISLCTYPFDRCNPTALIDFILKHRFALIKRDKEWRQAGSPGKNKVEETLRESEEKYRNIVETANKGIWIIDSEDRTTYVNKKIVEMLGYGQEEMIGRSGWDFTDEEEAVIIKMNMKEKQQNINLSDEFKLIRKDGSSLWAHADIKSFFNEAGKFTGYLGIFTDIGKHRQEEHRICRCNRVLEGINWIFSNIVQAKTEEELGNTCLSVALEVTGSEFGFINEIGTDGLLHDIAKSELGWEQCQLYDKTGHYRPQSNFVVHGLYGSVIKNEKSFFTNDPQSHPDSIGVPYGHPPLKSFLGVPLVQDREVIGLIAVANRESGYSFEQQEDLEAIAPAVVQALQRKRAEEALRLSNLYNRSLIEASLDPLVTIGADGKITDVNGATEQITGYSRNELIGTDFSDYFTESGEADKGYQQVFMRGVIRDYPLEIRHRDGHITSVLYNASVYRDETGKVIGVFAAARDITDRKKADETVKRAYENLEKLVKERTAELEEVNKSLKESEAGLAEAQKMAHIGNWDWNLITEKVYWSDELYRIFGRDPKKSGPSYDELLSYVHPEDREFVDKSIREGLNDKPKNSIDYRIILDNGEERKVRAKAEVIFDEQNVPIRVKGIIQDITELKKAEQALAEINRIRIKEIHHRIKNNLQVISSLLDLEAEKFQDKKVLEAFRESQNRVISMALIHEELYKGGAESLNFMAYLQKLAENLFQTYRLSSKNVSLYMNVERDTFFDIDTAVPLGIIVNELISNSLKHAFTECKNGEIRIQLSREKYDTNIHRSAFNLVISDNGKGIPDDIKPGSTESLGLKLVKILVEQLDGKIELKKTHGTEIKIIFNVTHACH